MMITHNFLCSGPEQMNGKWAASVGIHYSLSTTLLHVNHLSTDRTIISSHRSFAPFNSLPPPTSQPPPYDSSSNAFISYKTSNEH